MHSRRLRHISVYRRVGLRLGASAGVAGAHAGDVSGATPGQTVLRLAPCTVAMRTALGEETPAGAPCVPPDRIRGHGLGIVRVEDLRAVTRGPERPRPNRTSPGIVEMTEPRRSKACPKPRPCTPSRHAGSRCWRAGSLDRVAPLAMTIGSLVIASRKAARQPSLKTDCISETV